jgi:hypothetical protein
MVNYGMFREVVMDELYDHINPNNPPNISRKLKLKDMLNKITRESLFKEAIDSKDVSILKKIIRAEMAELFYDLFRRKSSWA